MRNGFTLLLVGLVVSLPARAAPPNLIVILCDDLGYGDLGCFGNPKIKTPNLDRLAREGVRFTDFYAGGAQCTPSRAGMLTGRYPARFRLTFSLMTNAGAGIPRSEVLLPELLRRRGYATFLAGKWHLGDQPQFHPTRHGFEHFEGLLRGHDTEPREYWRDQQIVDKEAELTTLTQRYVGAATRFIAEQAKQERPFFLMLAHTSPHTPLAPGAAFKGKSAGGTYGDCVEEIDDSVGRILETLKTSGVADNTLIFFASDNGPFVRDDGQGGSTGPLRAGKFSTYEGGIRVPAIFWFPSRAKARVERRPAMLLDVFPTFLSLAGATPPSDRAVDGVDLSPVLFEQKARGGPTLFFYLQDELQACRSGNWKLKLDNGKTELFDLSKDPSEAHDLSATNADVVTRLRGEMDAFQKKIARR
jgi:arylsulfatase A-like enzyme